MLRRRANARNVSFSNSLRRLIYLYQLQVDNQLVGKTERRSQRSPRAFFNMQACTGGAVAKSGPTLPFPFL